MHDAEKTTQQLLAELEALRGQIAELDTQRRQAEDALREEKQLLGALIHSLPGSFFMVDPAGHLVLWNRYFEQQSGVRPERLRGIDALSLVHEEDRTLALEKLKDVLDKGEAQFELRALAENGEFHPYVFHAARTTLGGQTHALATGLDIGDWRQAEQALRDSEERLRLALAGADLGTWDWHIPTGTMRYNERWAAILGYALDEVRPDVSTWHAMLHPDEAPQLMETLVERFEGRTNKYEAEHRMRHKSGEWIWVLSTGSVTERDTEGKAVRASGMLLDINARKQAEKARENLEAQLAQAQKMESVGRLAGGVAHDFNNLLTAILGYTEMELANAEGLAPGVLESFLEIRKAGERARDLTRQLLAFGRKQTLEVRVLDLNELVVNLGRMLNRLIGEDVRIKTILDASVGKVRADASQIEQVLLNLAVNARDAMPAGGVLTVETSNVRLDATYAASHSEVPPGDYVMLSVGDTGCGMDAATLKMAFEPFFTTKGPGQGTGLGLATVYGIVRQHEGHIVVYSEPGFGTTIKIYLPRATEAASGTIPPPAVIAPLTGSATVLVVEDDAPVRRLTTLVLTRLGYEAIEADGGLAAVLIAANRKNIDLLVTDVIMPEMSGRQVYEEVRVLHPQIRVLYVSGYTANIIAHHGILEEGVHLLQKPFSVQTLAQKVHEVLAR